MKKYIDKEKDELLDIFRNEIKESIDNEILRKIKEDLEFLDFINDLVTKDYNFIKFEDIQYGKR